jgi:glycosyltransferase 2 family protein
VATSLLQGVIPIPGGIGVTEAVMTGFLVALGVEESIAFAATVSYRVITFYLPAFEGFFAMRWLEKNKYL